MWTLCWKLTLQEVTRVTYLDLLVQLLLEGSTSLFEQDFSHLICQIHHLLPLDPELINLLNLTPRQPQLKLPDMVSYTCVQLKTKTICLT